MKAKITAFLIALAIVFTGGHAEARVVKNEQSWIDRIFSNDSGEMIQKSPFSQPQPRYKNPRARQHQNDAYKSSDDDRTQAIKQPERNTRGRRAGNAPKNNLNQNYADRIQTLRQQRMNAMRGSQPPANTGVND